MSETVASLTAKIEALQRDVEEDRRAFREFVKDEFKPLRSDIVGVKIFQSALAAIWTAAAAAGGYVGRMLQHG